MDRILKGLNSEQKSAVMHTKGIQLILAGAGSGKTRTLCARAAIAIQDEKLDPNQVLILAFNKAAAAEVEKRISKWAGNQSYSNARTFHSLAYQLIQPKKQLLFDAGGEPSQSDLSRFVQRRLEGIARLRFKHVPSKPPHGGRSRCHRRWLLLKQQNLLIGPRPRPICPAC